MMMRAGKVAESVSTPRAASRPQSRGGGGFRLDRAAAPLLPRAAPTRPEISGLAGSAMYMIDDLASRRQTIDRLVRQAALGKSFTPGELLALQAQINAYGLQLEVVSRGVDRMVSAVKTTLNTQL